MTYAQFRLAKAALTQFLFLNMCEPMIGHRFHFKPIDPAREMTETEIKMYGAGGAIARFGIQ